MHIGSRIARNSSLIGLLGLLTLIVGLVILILLPDIGIEAWIVLGLGLLLLAAAFFIEAKAIRGGVSSRRGRFGVGSTLMAFLFVGIMLLANGISVAQYYQWNLTSLSDFSLTPQTKAVLASLNKPVRAIAFLSPDNDPENLSAFAKSVLLDYREHTDNLEVEFIDPEARPDLARINNVTQYQSVVFESETRVKLVLPQEIYAQAEYAFTSAILEVTGMAQKKVYFLIGHGEPDITAIDPAGYSSAGQGLLEDLFRVDTLDFINNAFVPNDAAVLVIAAPKKELSSREIAAIDTFVLLGGRLLILGTPSSPDSLNELLAPWGIQFGTGTIIDPASYATPNKNAPSVSKDRNAFGLPITYFPDATAIVPREDFQGDISISPLLVTTDRSWLESEFEPGIEPAYEPGPDSIGPLSIGVAVFALPQQNQGQTTDPNGTLHLVVIGNSDFASNQHYANGNNGDMFLNAVSMLAGQIPLISMRHNVLPFRRMIISPEVAGFIKYSSVALVPILVLMAGAIVWWRRR